jgi:hypothetical protein
VRVIERTSAAEAFRGIMILEMAECNNYSKVASTKVSLAWHRCSGGMIMMIPRGDK